MVTPYTSKCVITYVPIKNGQFFNNDLSKNSIKRRLLQLIIRKNHNIKHNKHEKFIKLFDISCEPKIFDSILDQQFYNMQRELNCSMGYVDFCNLNEKNIYNLPEVYNDASYEIEDLSEYNIAKESNLTSDLMENDSYLLYPHNMSQSDVVKISENIGYSINCTVSIVTEVIKIMGHKIFPKSSIQKQAYSLKVCQKEIN
ncbi:hypothetical protein A3Q56_07890 [Intoshia linei]|uniref:Uncharacterized protein n=1 Tax=Intoshia linei TaxID=1819745 RepID=A0A177AQV6_9BILA|nr:hypothetical protein A3Q56_07890 [Intoshia linei]